ncbi:hypothetical protein [Thioalkalivibrio sp. ALE11]|uniref:hypothetical protein n=1 Tax=Thioalkalivibrio sp. ALE11 TaxID=1265494 RepID=UPI00039CEDBC|nr:hypothetical protein [Thioalkalivibrio sp. ALE11]
MTKTLYLHVGFGKTGSSALQNWLGEISPSLMKSGIKYPGSHLREDGGGSGISADWAYTISSGNAAPLKRALLKRDAAPFLNAQFSSSQGAVLFSSEGLQGLSPSTLEYLKDVSRDLSIDVVIIAYIRNIYEAAYSDYQQRVKGRFLDKSFRAFCLERHGNPQVSALRKFEGVFDDIRLIHYDTEATAGIDLALLRALGVQAPIPRMREHRVNRSLTVLESELMRFFNKQYLLVHPGAKGGAGGPGRVLSDTLIKSNPEASPELLLDEVVLEHLRHLHGAEVERVNRKYFKEERLKVLGATTRKTLESPPELPEAVRNFVTALVQQSGRLFPATDSTDSEPLWRRVKSWLFRERKTRRSDRASVDGGEVGSGMSGRIDSPDRGSAGQADILGWVDRVDRFGVVGWAAAPRNPGQTVEVLVVLDGLVVGRSRCEAFRPDVLEAGKHPTGLCGFAFDWPRNTVRQGLRQIEVRIDGAEAYRFSTEIRF